MPRGDKSAYTDKQKRQAEHIEEGYEKRGVPKDEAEARAWATAEMLRRARGFVTAAGTTHGTPDMVIGSKLHLDRVGAPFTGGGYYVTRVHHSYDRGSGFRTHFEAERATVNEGGR